MKLGSIMNLDGVECQHIDVTACTAEGNMCLRSLEKHLYEFLSSYNIVLCWDNVFET